MISQREKTAVIKEEVGRRGGSLLEEGGFLGSRSSRLLGLVLCLMMMVRFFIEIGSVSDDDDDGFGKRKRRKPKDQP